MNVHENVDNHNHSFQSFMMVEHIVDPGAQTQAGCDLQEAGQRVIALCSTRDDRFKDLACALVVYDYHGAPSNWQPEYEHEQTIIDWAKRVMEKEDPEDIDVVIDSYKSGYIPDCFEFLINYC